MSTFAFRMRSLASLNRSISLEKHVRAKEYWRARLRNGNVNSRILDTQTTVTATDGFGLSGVVFVRLFVCLRGRAW